MKPPQFEIGSAVSVVGNVASLSKYQLDGEWIYRVKVEGQHGKVEIEIGEPYIFDGVKDGH